MTITSTIVVTRNRDDVWSFLADLRNAPRWDRSIARATLTSNGPIGTGAIVEATSPGGKRQSFRITAFERPRLLAFRLLRSSLFRSADLTFSLEAADAGTRITHEIDVRVQLWLLILSPVLSLIGRRALSTDLDYLRRSLEERLDLTRPATHES
jgi:polyketide cyclase/dehydrase/lipid transport protein